MAHRMAQQAQTNIQNSGLAPLGTPTPVEHVANGSTPMGAPVATTPGGWPGADGASPYSVPQPPAAGGPAPRPQSIEDQMQAQRQVNPQSIGEQINATQIEQRLAASEAQTAAMLQQIQASNAQMGQYMQQGASAQERQAQFAQQQLDLQRQAQLAAQQQQVLTPEEQFALSEAETAQFGDSLSVIDKRAQLHAAQQAAQLKQELASNPKLAELEQKLADANARLDEMSQRGEQDFQTNVSNALAEAGLPHPDVLKMNPQWLAMMAESQQSVPGSVVGSSFGDAVNSALQSQNLNALNAVFQEFSKRQTGQLNPQNVGNELPAGGNPRTPSAGQPPAQVNMQAVESEIQQLQAREATLREAHRRGRSLDGQPLDNAAFMGEMQLIEARREEILKALQ